MNIFIIIKNVIKFFYIIIFYSLFFSNSVFGECAKPEMPSDIEWKNWLDYIHKEAMNIGIKEKIIKNEISHIKPLRKIIMRDRCQPESTITFKEYLYYRLDKTRIFTGKSNRKKYNEELNNISSYFNIQPRFIVAIWGMESYYGTNQGKSKIIPALITLSYDKRRSEFYKKQLFAALKILNENYISSENLIGSWAGAMGQVQFLPTTYLDSAIDFDQDGKKDIWNNRSDVFASIANYLTSIDKAPWNKDESWGIEILPPKNIESIYNLLQQKNPKGCYAVKTMSEQKKLLEWNQLGFRNLDGTPLKEIHLNARLVAPDKLKGRMFLVFPNYKSILYYNCSHYYALSIGLLSDKILE